MIEPTSQTKKVKQLFLIDAAGAALSVILLGLILPHFEALLGMPTKMLYPLAVLPVLFLCYDLYYYNKRNLQLASGLKGIALMNLCYCLLSLSLSIYHRALLTQLGWLYLIVELMVIVTLSVIELKAARQLVESIS